MHNQLPTEAASNPASFKGVVAVIEGGNHSRGWQQNECGNKRQINNVNQVTP